MPADLTVAEIVRLYLDHLQARVVRGDFGKHCLDDITRELTRFAARHGGQTMAQCRRHDLTGWLDANPKQKSNHTRKRVLGTLIRPFLWAEDEQLIAASPYRRPRKLRLYCRPRRAASEAEYVAIMRGGSRPLRRAIFFLRRTGARTCEMRELRWDQVNLTEGYIRLEKHKAVNLQENCPPRIIGLEAVIWRFLRNLHGRRPPGQQYVFLANNGQPWRTRHVFDRHFRRTADRLGLSKDLQPYCLRHLYGETATLAGVGERQLADQMGHASTRMTSWYSKTAGKIAHLRRVAGEALRRQR